MSLREGSTALDVYADPAAERLGTPATIVTAARTVGAVVLAGLAAGQESLPLLVASLAVYWVGDILDGTVARLWHCETRIGAVLDLLCDRLSGAAFYLGLVWLEPGFALPVLVYLTSFVVVDGFLSLAFLAWPLRSPNYFHAVDHTIWVWNWSKPAKAANSALFALLLLVTDRPSVGLATAGVLMVVKCASLGRLVRIGLPVPAR
jgi:CDP-diacylglycerol---glycerol-3-phosphate 3-phosphatidyltransferase